MTRTTRLAIAAVIVAAACQTKRDKTDESAPRPAAEPAATNRAAEPKPPIKAPAGNATAAITLTGAIEKTLSGPTAFCAIPMIGGKASGASFGVKDGDVQLSILAISEAELATPKIVVNTKDASYVLRGTATAKLAAGTSAEVEADLERAGTKETVHAKGTITCD